MIIDLKRCQNDIHSSSFYYLLHIPMKKNLIVLWILAWLFLIWSVVMTILYSKEKKSYETMTKFSIILVESFANSVDYTLCWADVNLKNTNSKNCEKYTEKFIADTKELRENFGMKTDYNYIGD